VAKDAAVIHVMAGVMLDSAGRVLLAQRPAGKHLAGQWEFPGGKLEPDEAPEPALIRELREELGIEAEPGEALIRIPWRYEGRSLLLDARLVRRWRGEPASLEHQALQWRAPAEVDLAALAPADRPILQALRLPAVYPITPADLAPESFEIWSSRLRDAISAGERLLQLRLPLWPASLVRTLASQLLPHARQHGATLILNGDIDGARQLGQGVGVQLKATQLMALGQRPLPLHQTIGASCHDAAQLALAGNGLADFATLSPLAATATHPAAAPLGWPAFRSLVESAALPVYALGGMSRADLPEARAMSGQGVAGIRGFWS
jgi:8-oxo-dGTP diphosphatase